MVAPRLCWVNQRADGMASEKSSETQDVCGNQPVIGVGKLRAPPFGLFEMVQSIS